MPSARIRIVGCHADHELAIEAVVDGRPGRRGLGWPHLRATMFIVLYADCRGSPVDFVIRDAAVLAYDGPPS